MSENITSITPEFDAEGGTYGPTTTDLVVSDMLPIFIFCFIILILPVWCRAREEGQCDGMSGIFDRLSLRRAQSDIDDDAKKLSKKLNHEYLYGLEDDVEDLDPQDLSAMIYYQSIMKTRSEDKLKRARSRDSSMNYSSPPSRGTPANFPITKLPTPTMLESGVKSDILLK